MSGPWELFKKDEGKKPWERFKPKAEQPLGLSWADVPMEALRNTPQSAYNFGRAIVEPIIHPISTLQTVGDMGAGALREGARAIIPESAFNYIDSFGDQDAAERASETAGAVGQFYKQRYGSGEGFKNYVATDPIGVMGDISTLLTLGRVGASRIAGPAAKITRGLDIAADVTNPLTVAAKAAKGAGAVAGVGAKGLFGLTTGTGYDTVGEAYKAGRKGGATKRAFTENLRGHESQAAVIEEARDAVGQIARKRAQQYTQDMAAIKADKTPIAFQPIEKKFLDIVDTMYSGKHQVAADETIAKLTKIQDVLADWSADPSMHTAGGLDALKRRIDNLMPSFSDANVGDTERAITAIRNSVKDEVVNAAPKYRDAMKGYEASKSAQREIERSLSLGKGSAADTTLRKLQSLTRNNVNTNYGSRKASADILKDAGAETLMPRLAGQAMSTVVPRGLMSAAAGASIIGGGLLSPALWAVLPMTSPRLVGEGLQAAGSGARISKKIMEALSKRTGMSTRELLLLMRQGGNAGLLGQQSQQ